MVFGGEAILVPVREVGRARYDEVCGRRLGACDEGWAEHDEETKLNAETTYNRTNSSF